MGKKRSRVGQLELDVLKIIWESQHCTVQEVAEILEKRRGYARTTILTVMQRLHRKGFLKRRKVGGLFRYSPTEKRSKVVSRLVGQFVDTVLDGSALPFVTYLTQSESLTKEQVSALRKIAEDLQGGKEK
jgi:predicted transcriptional regulator